MYERLRDLLLPILKIEARHPAPLPGHDEDEAVQVVRASPAYLRYRLFFWKLYAVAWAAAVLVASIVLVAINGWFILLVIPLAAIATFKAAFLYVATRLDYELRWYVLTERSVLIREGAWTVREICLTFANAQNVRVTQGPLQRWFGFSNVEIDTAGGGGKEEPQGVQAHRASLRGLADPKPVRDRVLALLRRHQNVGLGDPDDPAPERAPRSLDPSLLQAILAETRQLRSVLR